MITGKSEFRVSQIYKSGDEEEMKNHGTQYHPGAPNSSGFPRYLWLELEVTSRNQREATVTTQK